jgi:predicted CXXCH cytochrome family protein
MADLFKKSVHAKAFADMGSPGCATCHENHAIKEASDSMLGLDAKAVCATCHSADDKGGKSAVAMRALIDSLASAAEKARGTLGQAEHAGMEVSQGQFDLTGARESLVKARTAVHSFDAGAVKQEVEPGLSIAEKAQARGVRALEDLRFRKKGLGVSLVIIVALIGGLVMKIRQVDRRRPGPPPSEKGDA